LRGGAAHFAIHAAIHVRENDFSPLIANGAVDRRPQLISFALEIADIAVNLALFFRQIAALLSESGDFVFVT
jgi:hypothetical protein